MNSSVTARDKRLAERCSGTGEALYWDIEDIQYHCRISRTTAWRLVRNEEQFPSPVVLGPRSIVWPQREVVAFFEARRRPSHYRRPSTTIPNGLSSAREVLTYVRRELPVRQASRRDG